MMLSPRMNYFLLFFFVFVHFARIYGLNESCGKNSDCTTTNSVCINKKCICDDLSYYNETLCLPYATEYDAYCYETSQCEWLGDNAECKRNRCVCKDNFRWYRGKCQAYVDKGEKCQSDNECYNGYDLLSLSCSSGTCSCSRDYYDRGYDCRKSSTIFNDCALNIDCGSLINLVCTLGKCTLPSNIESRGFSEDLELLVEESKIVVSGNVEETISCRNDDDCIDINNSVCDLVSGACGCKENSHYYYNGNCVRGLNYCGSMDECTGNNTMCFKHSCICQRGFFLKDKQCIAELGMVDPHTTYANDSVCPIKPGKLYNSACYCKNYWFNDAANRNCIKTMIQSTHSCLTNEWCAAMGPYSFCNSSTSTCQCSSFATFNETIYYCQKNEIVTDICLKNSDCGVSERCLDEKCECYEDFTRNDDSICLPNIGASCEITSCSHIGNASCAAGVCACHENFIGKEARCLKIADDLYDRCEEEDQCENIDHSVCGAVVDENTLFKDEDFACICEEGYNAINTKCYQTKKYGDPCMTEEDCTLVLNRSYKCRNNICQCAVGMKLKNGYCTSSASTIFGSFALLVTIVVKLVMI